MPRKPPDPKRDGRDERAEQEVIDAVVGDPATHRRVLGFLNDAVRADDLMFEPPTAILGEGHLFPDHDPVRPHGEQPLLPAEVAHEVLALRDARFPLGFRHLNELRQLIDLDRWRWLFEWLSRRFRGSWSDFPHHIPGRGPGGIAGVVHAAVLHTGQVLFITADETTLLWDPQNATPATFEDPVNQPHLMPGGYSQLCSHHVFLSDGQLLTVGGGGYGHNPLAHWGYRFNPTTKTWTRTAGSMAESRWYPTVVKLGDQGVTANDHRVLVTCGHGGGDMEIYDEGSDSFTPVTGDTKTFPSLYPGLHLLPSHAVLYSGTGWGSAGPNAGPFGGASDDQSAFFSMTGPTTGAWHDIAPVSPARPDRTKGMSVMLLANTPPYVRVLVVGGADPSTNHTYELLDATALSPAANWSPPAAFPDGEHRSLAASCCSPTATCSCAAASNTPTRRARCSTRARTHGHRWRRCHRNATTTRSRSSCRAVRSLSPAGTTP